MYLKALARARDFVDLEKSSLEAAMRVAAPWASGALLDVGCGDKPYEALFARHVTRYVGVEYEPTSEHARERGADVVYSGAELPFDAGSFDTVLCNQVAEHVPAPQRFFTDLTRVLRRGGRLILTVPFSFRVHSAPHDFHRFTRYALEGYARENGLRIDLLSARGGLWTVIGQKLTSHMALRFARLGGDIQKIGGFGHERAIRQKPRYWSLPGIAPAVVLVSLAARVLDRVDHDESDTLGYLLVATKE